MGSRSHPHRCLVCVRVRMCEQVSVGVCDWGWFAPAESHHRWAISVPVTLSPLSDPCSCLRSSFTVRSGSAIPEPCCFLDSDRRTLAAHCFPALPASALRKAPHLPTESSVSALRKAPHLPTESSVSALRKAPHLPTESSVSAYGSSASALRKAPLLLTEASAFVLRKAPFSFSLCITSVINSFSATESSRLHCDTDTFMVITFAGALRQALVYCVRLNAEPFSCADSKHRRAALSRGSTDSCFSTRVAIFFITNWWMSKI